MKIDQSDKRSLRQDDIFLMRYGVRKIRGQSLWCCSPIGKDGKLISPYVPAHLFKSKAEALKWCERMNAERSGK